MDVELLRKSSHGEAGLIAGHQVVNLTSGKSSRALSRTLTRSDYWGSWAPIRLTQVSMQAHDSRECFMVRELSAHLHQWKLFEVNVSGGAGP